LIFLKVKSKEKFGAQQNNDINLIKKELSYLNQE